jgi:hypothetical protein
MANVEYPSRRFPGQTPTRQGWEKRRVRVLGVTHAGKCRSEVSDGLVIGGAEVD